MGGSVGMAGRKSKKRRENLGLGLPIVKSDAQTGWNRPHAAEVCSHSPAAFVNLGGLTPYCGVRLLPAFLAALFLSSTSAGANYSTCVAATDPPACMARKGIADGFPGRDDVADAIIRHGLMDLLPRNSNLLVRVTQEKLGASGLPLDAKVALAAAALLTAARHQVDPFTDPAVQPLTRAATNDPMIAFIALHLWRKLIKHNDGLGEFVTFAGLPAIWQKVVANRERAPDLAQDLAGSLARYEVLGDETRKFMMWYAARPALSAQQKADTASQLVKYFSLADEAERLMNSGGDAATDHDVAATRASIAVAKLASRYDAKAARRVVAIIIDDKSEPRGGLRVDDEQRDALEKSGAKAELREIAAEYLRRAEAAGPGAKAATWYAEASDCYRRAGDREKARVIARKGLPFVARTVRAHIAAHTDVTSLSTQRLASMAGGGGTDPVVALYRTGAIDEAIEFGYLSGNDRLENAKFAGEPRNPQWMNDDYFPLYLSSMVTSAISHGDPAWRRQVFDVLKKVCVTGYADCDDQTLAQLAALAARIGDETEMKRILTARANQIYTSLKSISSAIPLAADYAYDLELLKANR